LDDSRLDEWRRAQLDYYRGRLALAQGDHEAARARFTQTLEVFERRPARIAMSVLARIGLAEAEQALGNHQQAVGRAEDAIALAESFVEPEQPSYLVGLARAALARAQAADGEPAAARESLARAARHLEATLGDEHPATRAARAAAPL
jgi:tetratricopeptide (TPR) repeat protein